MITKNGNISRYIGGGELLYTPKGGTERKIGEIQSAKFSLNAEFAEAYDRSSSMKKLSAKVTKSISGKLEFTTNNVNLENMAMALAGKVEDVTFGAGEKLPDGSTAAAATTLKCIKGGTNPIIEGSFKFIGDSDGDEKPILVIYRANVTASGEFDYIAEEHQQLSFSGEVLEDDGKYFDEYRMATS